MFSSMAVKLIITGEGFIFLDFYLITGIRRNVPKR